MAVSINTNLNALRAVRRLDEASYARERTFERLASGSRINRAGDDAAGLAVASSLNLDSRISSQAVRNVSDGASFLNVADGAAKELKNILIRLRELATQSSNGAFSNLQRASLDKEAQALQAEYNRVVETAKFNGTSVFGGSVAVQAGVGEAAVLVVGGELGQSLSGTGVGDGTFQAMLLFPTGLNPASVAAADLNGDGKLDLVTADNGGATTSVLLGNGDGTFQVRKSFALGGNPGEVRAADLNGDGKLDLVITNNGGPSVLLGNGDGTFQTSKSFAMSGTSPASVAAADVNGDGKLDLVTADPSSNTASVLLGNGNGTFQARKSFVTGSYPYSVAAADFNGDGTLDLVTADKNSSTTSVLLGNGNGTFQARTSFAMGPGYSVAAADVNSDGKLDLVTADYGSNTTSVLLGNGDGTFQARRSFAAGASPWSVAAADLNGDGKLDLVTGDAGSNTTSVLLGNGDGTFQAMKSFASGGAHKSVAAADFNGDGVLDVVSAGSFSSVSVLLGNVAARVGLTPLSGVGVATQSAALSAQGRIDDYLDEVDSVSGSIGVGLSRLAVASANLQSNIEATKAAESRITDADVAEESERLVSTGILQQAAAAVLAHANQEPALALKLLQP